jgi:hypothetical protein
MTTPFSLSRRQLTRGACIAATGAIVVAGLGMARSPALAQADVIQSQDTNESGVVAEITQCKRKDGVLTIKMRLRNTSQQDIRVHVIESRGYDEYYVTAGDKKYFILKDTENVPLAPQTDGGGSLTPKIDKGGTYTWWAKYPAPPADVKSVSYYTSISAPFEDIPITD